MSKSKVLFLMTGSIACYKACQVISRLTQNNCEVQVVATPAALQFVGNATIEGLTGKSVISDLYTPGTVMEHIHLVRWADLILVAPATANFLNKAAAGIADDLVSTLFLAHDFKKPFLVAPAMNTMMYQHPTTQNSLKKLREMGVELLDTNAGILACGEEGYGRLLEPDQILKETLARLNAFESRDAVNGASSSATASPSTQASRRAYRILITAGGTQEPIDSVRKITNTSSGQTGLALACGFSELGCEVTLLRAKNATPAPTWIESDSFSRFSDLNEKLQTLLSTSEFDAVIHLAAVSDYSVASVESLGASGPVSETQKLSSEGDEIIVRLKKNFKIVARLKSYSKNMDVKIVAFKLTSQASEAEATAAVQKLLKSSGADIIVHNDLQNIDQTKNQHDFSVYGVGPAPIACAGVDSLLGVLSSELLEVGV